MTTPNLPILSADLFRLVIRLNATIFSREELFKAMPLPTSHVKVLFYLIHHDSSTMSHLSTHLSISKPNLTPIIDKLLEEGLVSRLDNPKDRRTVLIETTELAHQLFEKHAEYIKGKLASRIEHLSKEELLVLEESTAKLLPLLDKISNI